MVRPGPGAEQLVAAEAGPGVEVVPDALDGCADAVVAAAQPG
jgi:hypothetical protein